MWEQDIGSFQVATSLDDIKAAGEGAVNTFNADARKLPGVAEVKLRKSPRDTGKEEGYSSREGKGSASPRFSMRGRARELKASLLRVSPTPLVPLSSITMSLFVTNEGRQSG